MAAKSGEGRGDHGTRGVAILTGDPRAAILKLSGPMVVAMLLMSLYQIVDAIWVAGLGSDALAAVGFVMPVFFILMGLGIGLGAGVTSAMARRIGAGDRAGADNVAMHAFVLAAGLSLVLTVPLILLARPVMAGLGAGDVTGLAVTYGSIVFGGTVFLLFTSLAYSVLRGEGDTRRTMYAMGASSILNMVLDPLLIYNAGLGIAGAALATVISIAFVSLILLYWFMVRRDTYVRLDFSIFRAEREIIRDIFEVGIPGTMEFAFMAGVGIILNGILATISGTDAVAVYSAGWRVVSFAVIPMVAIGTAVISVAGAAYGARKYSRIVYVHSFSIRMGIAIGIATGIFTWIAAPQIALLFAYSPESMHLAPDIVVFLRTMVFFYPFIPPGLFSGSIFQGTGKGMTSLAVNALRTMVFIVLFVYLLAVWAGLGVTGVWWGIVAGDIAGALVGYLWARLYLSRLVATAF